MWKLVLNICLGKAHSSEDPSWYIKYRLDRSIHFGAFLEVFEDIVTQLLLVASHEQLCHVIRVRHFPISYRA